MGLTHTGPLAEGHEGAENAAHGVRALLNGEASLQLQGPLVVHHPERRKRAGQGAASAPEGDERWASLGLCIRIPSAKQWAYCCFMLVVSYLVLTSRKVRASLWLTSSKCP